MMKGTLFSPFKSCKGDISLLSAFYGIRDGKCAPAIHSLRAKREAGDLAGAEQIKKELPAFTVSATYQGIRKAKGLKTYNPLLILDIDGLEAGQVPVLRALIEGAYYTVCCYVTASGYGLKVIAYSAVQVELVPVNHRQIYDTMKDWYAALLRVPIDVSGSDVGRLSFFSYDPDIYISPRYLGWLGGTEALPSDIPLLALPSKKQKPSALLVARKRANNKYTYTEGNRNNYIHLFASHCNRLGVPKEEMLAYCTAHFTDFPPVELHQAAESAYNRTEQHATAKGKQGCQVERIQSYLSNLYILRKNVVRGLVEYKKKSTSKGYRPVTDYWENSVWCDLQLAEIICKLNELRAIIHSNFSKEYDPFASYFSSLSLWDGQTDFIGELAATIHTTQPVYWATCLRKWLVAVVACALDEGKENHSVLLLSGEQGRGKTTWCRHLVPPELKQYVYSGNLDPSSKDASLLMSDCFLIILDELSGQSRMELNRLKAMITKDSIHERRAYAHNAETYARRASFAATVNDSQVLTDRTGSRRFLCFETLSIDYTTPVNHAGVYTQALALYRSGFKYWFSDTDINEINYNNEPFQQSSPEEELFFTYFRRPERFEAPLYLSSSEIVAKIAEKTRLSITTINVNNLGKMLKRMQFEQQKRGSKRTFCVIELTFNQVKANNAGIGYTLDKDDNSSESSDNKDDEADPVFAF